MFCYVNKDWLGLESGQKSNDYWRTDFPYKFTVTHREKTISRQTHLPYICGGAYLKAVTLKFVFRIGVSDLQQPTESQIKSICMGIYRKIDETVKMDINSCYGIHTA